MNKTRVKVCGITKVHQAKELSKMGVDAIGIIFYKKSPRFVPVDQAILIRKSIPAFVNVVGVFVDHTAIQINQICTQVGLNLVQLHGDQDVEFASQLTHPYIKAVRVDSVQKINDEMSVYTNSTGFLLDTFSHEQFGGTGHRIDEALLPDNLPENVILAGGINVDNIDEVLMKKPFAIDINSGVELSPGDKNLDLVTQIMQKVKI